MDNLIQEIGSLILRCEDSLEESWDTLSVVFDLGNGYISNSGFMYERDNIIPMIADIEDDPMVLDNKIHKFQAAVEEKFGHKFKQLLIQMEQESGRIKIDFEFDNPKRWNMDPSNYIKVQEELRPQFDW